eukprot:2754849-Prymnesium_polylepis.2
MPKAVTTTLDDSRPTPTIPAAPMEDDSPSIGSSCASLSGGGRGGSGTRGLERRMKTTASGGRCNEKSYRSLNTLERRDNRDATVPKRRRIIAEDLNWSVSIASTLTATNRATGSSTQVTSPAETC